MVVPTRLRAFSMFSGNGEPLHQKRIQGYRKKLKKLMSTTITTQAFRTEYLTANILELAGQEAHNNHKMCITPEHVHRALGNNQHLSHLFEDNTYARVEAVPQPKEWVESCQNNTF
ncbi:hypothetical protein GH733_019087 [Mirounga leonina]|nr:hypothetical protein GH733_019087 [Mirounga leonina]